MKKPAPQILRNTTELFTYVSVFVCAPTVFPECIWWFRAALLQYGLLRSEHFVHSLRSERSIFHGADCHYQNPGFTQQLRSPALCALAFRTKVSIPPRLFLVTFAKYRTIFLLSCWRLLCARWNVAQKGHSAEPSLIPMSIRCGRDAPHSLRDERMTSTSTRQPTSRPSWLAAVSLSTLASRKFSFMPWGLRSVVPSTWPSKLRHNFRGLWS